MVQLVDGSGGLELGSYSFEDLYDLGSYSDENNPIVNPALPFALLQLEPDVWETGLTSNGLPNTPLGVITISPVMIVSQRTYGSESCGFGLCGGVEVGSEDFTLQEAFK